MQSLVGFFRRFLGEEWPQSRAWLRTSSAQSRQMASGSYHAATTPRPPQRAKSGQAIRRVP